MSAQRGRLGPVDIEPHDPVADFLASKRKDSALRLALAALDIEPHYPKKAWSAAQYRQRAAARVALRDALGIKD